MKIGMSLPTMAKGFTSASFRSWCRAIDEGPYSSISAGERLTFVNPELLTSLAAAAALTSRVDIFANLVVAPLHPPAVLAKELATIDVLSEGRLVVGLGVGGRPHDYQAAGVAWTRRHQQVDDMALALRAIWSGESAFDGADPVGPSPVREGGPKLVAGAMGASSMARAAIWADGVTGFALTGTSAEFLEPAALAKSAWHAAGRSEEPWLGSGTFCVLGVPDATAVLHRFGADYLSFFGTEVANSIASRLDVATPEALRRVIDDAEAAGLDELTVVPGTWDLACLRAIDAVVGEQT